MIMITWDKKKKYMNQLELITPILTLVIWTFLIFLVMAFGRVKFMNNPQDAAHSKDYKDKLPAWVNRTADNYNHLFEQPVAFYAVTLSIALINDFDNLIVQLPVSSGTVVFQATKALDSISAVKWTLPG